MTRATEQQPTLTCPFPAAINPHADWVQEATASWAQRHGLLHSWQERQRFNRWQYGILMARAYPTATRADLALIADWNTWLFLLDDQFDEHALGRDPAALQHYCTYALEILQGVTRPGKESPIAFQALADLARRLAIHTDPELVTRLAACLKASFSASLWEAENRASNRIPSESEYRHYRPLTGAVDCYLTLIELAGRFQLTKDIQSHPWLRSLNRMTNHIICWSNDVVSFPREHAAGNAHNLITVVHYERHLTLEEASDYVVALHNAEVQQFQQTCRQLPAFGNENAAVQHYIQGLQWWIRANMDWSTSTTRYH